MSTAVAFKTPYELRIELVQSVVARETKLDEAAAHALSVSILQALDRIPEKIR